MQIRIFAIPIMGGELLERELNVFLRSKKVLQVKEHLVNNEKEGCFWCFCIRFTEDVAATDRERAKIDYRELLEEGAFKRFADFRQIRKRVAQEDAVPAYAVFTDNELAEMAKEELLTAETIKKVKGIGEKKLEKYGKHFLPKPSDEKGR